MSFNSHCLETDEKLNSRILASFHEFHVAMFANYLWFFKKGGKGDTAFDYELFVRTNQDPNERKVCISCELI
jgi:hypothetical protein